MTPRAPSNFYTDNEAGKRHTEATLKRLCKRISCKTLQFKTMQLDETDSNLPVYIDCEYQRSLLKVTVVLINNVANFNLDFVIF